MKDSVLHDVSFARRRVQSFALSARDRTLEERELVEGARKLLRARINLMRVTPRNLLGDSAYDMMLVMFINDEEGGILYIKQLIGASGDTPASALRRIDRLEDAGLVERSPDTLDHRRVIIRLSEQGRQTMLDMLRDVFCSGDRALVEPVSHSPPR
jgi:DNA-binding transcriptional ArsR family regulator